MDDRDLSLCKEDPERKINIESQHIGMEIEKGLWEGGGELPIWLVSVRLTKIIFKFQISKNV